MVRSLPLFVGLSCIVAGVAGAEPTHTLDLGQAIALAQQRALVARTTDLARRDADVEVHTRTAAFAPDLSFQASAGVGVGADGQPAAAVPWASSRLGLGSRLGLFEGGGRQAALRQSRVQLEAAEHDVLQIGLDLAWEMTSAFVVLAEAEAQKEVDQAALEAAEALLGRVQAQVDLGARTEVDRYQQQAVVASARADLAAAELAVTEANLALLSLLQLDPFEPVRFVLADTDGRVSIESTAEDLTRRAMGQRPDLAAAAAALRAAELEIPLQRSGGLPQLGLSMGLDSAWSSDVDGGFAVQLGGGIDAWTTLTLDVPIVDRSTTRDAVSRARLASRSVELGLDDARQEVGIQVRSALAARDAARIQREAAQVQLASAEAGLRLVTDRYEAGAALLVEVTSSQASVTAAARGEVRARWSERLYEAALAYVLGEIG